MPKWSIEQHLAQWGLRPFHEAEAYDVWQRQALSGHHLRGLQQAAQRRSEASDARADRDFYDLAASPDVLPIVYSQRYGYYQALGPVVAKRLDGAQRVMDVGCGVGILTTWYAACFPDITFLGVDRSLKSIEAARQVAHSWHLTNVRFEPCDIPRQAIPGGFDTIVSTQALFQSEADPGLPSRHWSTFERGHDDRRQRSLETRTGIGPRLDCLAQGFAPFGKLILFEKTRHLGRRVLFQRALRARGFRAVEDPRLLIYSELGETTEEGPLYVMKKDSASSAVALDETMKHDPQRGLYACQGRASDVVYGRLPKSEVRLGVVSEQVRKQGGSPITDVGDRPPITDVGDGPPIIDVKDGYDETGRTAGGLAYVRLVVPGVFSGLIVGLRECQSLMMEMVRHAMQQGQPEEPLERRLKRVWTEPESEAPEQSPLYENHGPSAQQVWRQLPDRVAVRQKTDEEPDGRQRHVEYGSCDGNVHYLYWANTFDQRQIVIMDQERRALLEAYFAEAVGEG